MRRINCSDIAKALRAGDITKEDLLRVADGWTPATPGRRSDIIRHAKILGVLTLLTASGVRKRIATDIIMSVGGLNGASAFDRLLDRAEKNWQPLPPFEITADGYRAVLLVCRHPNYFGHQYGVEIRLSDWK